MQWHFRQWKTEIKYNCIIGVRQDQIFLIYYIA